jgi:hypothetical protein
MDDFLRKTLTPQRLLTVLEELITEARLPADVARRIEHAVLERTHRSGLWQ